MNACLSVWAASVRLSRGCYERAWDGHLGIIKTEDCWRGTSVDVRMAHVWRKEIWKIEITHQYSVVSLLSSQLPKLILDSLGSIIHWALNIMEITEQDTHRATRVSVQMELHALWWKRKHDENWKLQSLAINMPRPALNVPATTTMKPGEKISYLLLGFQSHGKRE
ncbi:hypothetical protein ARMSODRAFT_983459 [Armillaria solidipes]|uniref:Uncharacterized protein n=1 Tax=Armillaria solidipes TaxID=1076256 RepID=A0A2H3AYR8_9AGAR|nr:hypothetical protein ARMSODRAFT_983459 [Armillaria solidipes]